MFHLLTLPMNIPEKWHPKNTGAIVRRLYHLSPEQRKLFHRFLFDSPERRWGMGWVDDGG